MLDTKGLTPIAIGCMPGSGSRVLRDVLDASPQVWMDPDFDPKTKDSMGSRPFLHEKDRSPAVLRPLIEQHMQTIVDGIPADRVTALRYFGWKNPGNINIIDLLLEIDPKFRFLHLVRDPASIAAGKHQRKSFKRRRSRGEVRGGLSRTRDALERWQDVNLPVWQAYHGHPNYLVVRYEDLITEPEATARSIFDWLSIDNFDIETVRAAIDPPPDPISRGDGIDVSMIAEACALLGYSHRLRRPANPTAR